MSFQEAVSTVLTKKYADFSGRARRSEYWWFVLAYALVVLVVDVLAIASGSHLFTFLLLAVILAVFLPSLAVTVRRLHDTNRSGWWVLLGFIPLGGFVILYFTILDSDAGTNQYGPSPKGSDAQFNQYGS